MGAITASATAVEVVPEGYTAVRTVLDLYKVRYNLAGNYILMNDIDLTEATAEGGDYDYGGNGWNPIGSGDVYGKTGEFTGIFDGNGYTIKGMRMDVTALPSGTGSELYLGLFANNVGTIKNLNISGSINYNLASSKIIYSGGVAAYNSGTIVGSSNEVTISVDNTKNYIYAGGIVAHNNGTIKECYNKTAIFVSYISSSSESRYAGGISGRGDTNSLIENCYNLGDITAKTTPTDYAASHYACAGGIQGSAYSGSYIKQCYNLGEIYASGDEHSAKAIGGGDAQNCYYLAGTGDSCTGATELTPEQTLIQSSYNGFDFDTVWEQNPNAIYEYPQLTSNLHDNRDLIKAEIHTLPNKTTFTKWEEFEVDGCVLEFTFTNADTEYVLVTKDMVTGYDMNKVGVQTLTIAANRRTLTYDITVLEKNFIPIYTPLDLYKVRYDLTANYILMNDIDLTEATAVGGDYDYSGNGWNPIGSEDIYGDSGEFTGIFDGNGYTIKGMRINITTLPSGTGYRLYLGLFANNAGIIKNLKIIGSINSTKSYGYYAGGVAAYNSGTIIGCANEVSIAIKNTSSDTYVGGMTGYNAGSVEECYNNAAITAVAASGTSSNVYAGGISGYGKDNSLIEDCYNSSDVYAKADYYSYFGSYSYGDAWAGGIQGYSYGSSVSRAIVKNCYNTGTITAIANKSGLYENSAITYIYSSSCAEVQNCYYLSGSGDSCTGATSLSAALIKEPTVLSGFDFDTVWTMGGEPDYDYPELQCFAVKGALSINGNVAYLSTVEPDLSKIGKKEDGFTYEWTVDGKIVSTADTYMPQSADIGKKLKIKVIGVGKYNKGTYYSNEVTVSKAIQTATPVVPTATLLNDNRLEITTVPEQEYSLDNINWQSSGVFADLEPNKEYAVYSRILENDLYLLGESQAVLTVTTDRRPITGSVNIVGTTAFGDTLTADVSAVGPDAKVTYRYEWKRGNEVVGTNKTYKIVKEDIDKTLTLYVIGVDDYIGTLSSAPVTATKASVQVPSAPVIENKTNNSVKLVETAGLEYSKDKVNWQDSALFKGLSPNTEYTFYQRVKETETEFSSKSSNGTKVATLKNTIVAPDKPVVENITNNTVTLKNISGYEYSLDGVVWQTSNIFSGLLPNTEYYFCQRVAETETDYASATSGYITVVTLKNTVNKPVAPVIESATDSTVTLVAVSGCEYSKNGTTWQKSNVFNNLEPLETYTFYQRVAETETDYASEKSDGTSFKVKFITSKPAVPVLVEVTNDKIVVETKTGYQYSIDGISWRRQGVFTGLNPNTTYAVCCRMPETDDYYTSANSNALNVTTLKNTVNTPGAPIVSAKTDVSVTLINTNGYEYSTNGTDWQASNVFNNLLPDTEYTFYQRVAETETDYVSEKSVGTTVKTYKKCEIDPQYHIYTSDCDVSCNECGFERQVPDHIYDNACDDTCNVENCGFVRTVGDHKYDNACDKSCNICGTTRTVGAHKYDNNCDKSCNICGTTRSVGAHKYSNSCDTTCNYCGAKRSINHTYTNSCDTKCNVCGATRTIKHTYSNNCDKTCNVCKSTRTVGAHKYTNACDTTCNYCNAKRSIKHTYSSSCDTSCNVCKATRTVTHSYKTITVKATLSKNGSVTKKCSICGKVASKATIKYVKSLKLSATTYSYNGKTKTPSVTVKDSAGKTLKKNTDYTVTYASGRKNVGTYKVVVKMKGKYSGSKTLTFTIKPTTKTSAELLIGATKSIGAKSNKSITYKSSNKKVATVSSKGVITAKAAGTATISVTANKITQKIKVTVKKPYVKISGTSSMLLKKSVKLKATSNTSAKVKWSSSNKKIATVSSSGKVTGQKAGTATIYAKITYKGKTYTGKYTVKVKKPYLTKTSATIDKGKTYQISVNGGSGTTTYTSSNKKVATVSSKGVVKGVGKGNATITVKRNGYSMKFTVKVNVNSDKEILAAYAEFVVKNCALKNPSSYQVNNYIYKKNGSSYTVYVWYSAANSFGGMVDGWAMAQFDTEKSVIAYSVTYGKKYINVYTGWSRPSTFDGYVDADAVEEEYDKIGTINYYRPII